MSTAGSLAQPQNPLPETPASARIHQKTFWKARGLTNLGNTCLLNSVTQGLFSSKLWTWIIENQLEMKEALKGESEPHMLTEALFDIFQELQIPPNDQLEPRKLLKAVVTCVDKKYGKGTQEDATELLIEVINTLTIELSRNPVNNPIHRLFGFVLKLVLDCVKCGGNSCPEEGRCGISIPILVTSNHLTLEDCFKEWNQPTPPQWKCSKCGSDGQSRQRLLLKTTPEILVIVLHRFSKESTGSKVLKTNQRVQIPENLDLTNLMEAPGRCQKFVPRGVIHHIGNTIAEGHYTTKIWHPIYEQ